jgi:hypothetical protein
VEKNAIDPHRTPVVFYCTVHNSKWFSLRIGLISALCGFFCGKLSGYVYMFGERSAFGSWEQRGGMLVDNSEQLWNRVSITLQQELSNVGFDSWIRPYGPFR